MSNISVNHVYADLEEWEIATPYLAAIVLAGFLIYVSDGIITILLLVFPLVTYLLIKNKTVEKQRTFNSNRV